MEEFKGLNRLKDAGMTLNASKCELAVNRIQFLGHVISSTCVCANPDAVGDIRPFLWIAKQLGKFSDSLRDLLCKDTQ